MAQTVKVTKPSAKRNAVVTNKVTKTTKNTKTQTPPKTISHIFESLMDLANKKSPKSPNARTTPFAMMIEQLGWGEERDCGELDSAWEKFAST